MNNETDFETVLNVYKRHNVDSFSDLPGNYFWEEFFTACPKAKVLPILTHFGIIIYLVIQKILTLFQNVHQTYGFELHNDWTFRSFWLCVTTKMFGFRFGILRLKLNRTVLTVIVFVRILKSYKSFLTNWHVEGIPRVNITWESNSLLILPHWQYRQAAGPLGGYFRPFSDLARFAFDKILNLQGGITYLNKFSII